MTWSDQDKRDCVQQTKQCDAWMTEAVAFKWVHESNTETQNKLHHPFEKSLNVETFQIYFRTHIAFDIYWYCCNVWLWNKCMDSKWIWNCKLLKRIFISIVSAYFTLQKKFVNTSADTFFILYVLCDNNIYNLI